MKSPHQYVADKFPWLTLRDSIVVAFVLVLAIVALWPHAHLVGDIVLITAIPGLAAAAVWGLTFWSKARVQFGRRKLRYKSVRRIAGLAAVAFLPFLMLQQTSIYLRGPNILRVRPIDPTGLSEPYPKQAKWKIRVVVAIAHLEGDDGHKVEGQLREALASLDPKLRVTPVILNQTITLAGRPQGIAHLEALTTVTDANVESLIWGAVNGASHSAVGPLYATRFGDYAQFGGAYLPGDFKLPDLPPDDLVKILRLMVATDSAEFMQAYKIEFGDVLAPLIREASAMADDPRKTAGWNADARARVNLVLGIANRTTGVELKSADYLKASAADFQRALGDWTHDRDPLEWAMAQRNLGAALTDLYNYTQDAANLHPAVTALQDALTVYQSKGDRIDAALVQSGIGGVYEGIGRYEPGVDNAKKAVEHLREAVKGIDPDKFPNAWGETQIELANELRVMSFWDKGTKDLDDAIAANQEALKIYSKRNSPIHWAEAQGQLAQCLIELGHATDNAGQLRQAISTLREVLDGYPRDSKPAEWAKLQSVLGDALMALYYLDPKSGFQYPPQAVTAYRASLEELTLEHDPIAWAEAKQGLGNALKELGYDTSNSDYLNQAIDAYNDFFKVIRPDQQPLQWANVKYERGEAYVYLGEQGPGIRYLQQGVQDYREALAALPKDGQDELRNAIQDDLKIALDDLHQRGSTGS